MLSNFIILPRCCKVFGFFKEICYTIRCQRFWSILNCLFVNFKQRRGRCSRLAPPHVLHLRQLPCVPVCKVQAGRMRCVAGASARGRLSAWALDSYNTAAAESLFNQGFVRVYAMPQGIAFSSFYQGFIRDSEHACYKLVLWSGEIPCFRRYG